MLVGRTIRLLSLILGCNEPRLLIIKTLLNRPTAGWLRRFHARNGRELFSMLLKRGIEFDNLIVVAGVDWRDNVLNSFVQVII